jgi:hypothetical protein
VKFYETGCLDEASSGDVFVDVEAKVDVAETFPKASSFREGSVRVFH